MHKVNNMKELNYFIKNNENVVLQFSASWCKPCKKFVERLEEESKTNEELSKLSVVYCDIDYEEFESLIEMFNIKSIPTLIFVKLEDNSVNEQFRVEGYDWYKFLDKVSEFLKQEISDFSNEFIN